MFGSSLRENYQRPNESVLTPRGRARHPISDQLSRPPAGARSSIRTQRPGCPSAHLPAATRLESARRATHVSLGCHRAQALPREFRDDVVAVARRGETPLKQVAKDFGISESCLANWLRAADVEDGTRPGVTRDESAELRELRKRNRLLEQENEVLRKAAAYLAQGNLPGK